MSHYADDSIQRLIDRSDALLERSWNVQWRMECALASVKETISRNTEWINKYGCPKDSASNPNDQ